MIHKSACVERNVVNRIEMKGIRQACFDTHCPAPLKSKHVLMTPVRGETMKKTAVLETYDNESAIRQMVKAQQHMRVPSTLLPVCPRCGKPMSMNLRSDNTFVENEGWHKAAERYQNFLQTHRGRNLFLEIGVGFNTPGIIKYPFWNMTAEILRLFFP